MIAPQEGHLFHSPSGMSDFFLPSEAMERFLKMPIQRLESCVVSVCSRRRSTGGPKGPWTVKNSVPGAITNQICGFWPGGGGHGNGTFAGFSGVGGRSGGRFDAAGAAPAPRRSGSRSPVPLTHKKPDCRCPGGRNQPMISAMALNSLASQSTSGFLRSLLRSEGNPIFPVMTRK